MTAPVREIRTGVRPGVLAVLPHYGNPADTLEAVDALLGSDYPHLRIVVVDNSGNIDPASLKDSVELVNPGENVGYCAAVNVGIRRAQSLDLPLLMMVNNDTVSRAGVIEDMVDVMLADESLAGVGPLLTMQAGERIWAAGSFLRFGPNEVKQRGLGKPVTKAPRFPEEVDFLPGALALYWTRDLQAIGGIDEDYFMYLEDVDLGHRLRERGRRLLYLPWIAVHHGGSISSGGGVTPLRKFLNGVNTPRLLRRCGSVKLWLSFILFDIVGLVPSLLLHLHNPRRLAAQFAKGRGILLGLRGYKPGPRDVEYYCGTNA